MNEQLLKGRVWCRVQAARLIKDESGEGVISVALAVLIMAFLAALMWVAFRQLWVDAESDIDTQVNSIGGGGPAGG